MKFIDIAKSLASANPYGGFLKVKQSKISGRGVFALKNFKKRAIVEVCPVITVRDKDIVQGSVLRQYLFSAKEEGCLACVLGNGMIYNHSPTPNTSWYRHSSGNIVFYALKPIPQDEELLFNYGKRWWSSRGMVPLG